MSWGNRILTPTRLGSVWIQPADQGASMRVFIGLDVSLAKTAVCVVDRDGVVQWQRKVPSEPGPLIRRLAECSDPPLTELARSRRGAGVRMTRTQISHEGGALLLEFL